jgi:hypothetical protein
MVVGVITGQRIVQEARALVGTRFRVGGIDPKIGLDHVSFVLYLANKFHLVSDDALIDYRNERGSERALNACKTLSPLVVEIPLSAVEAGDLIVFRLNWMLEGVAIVSSESPRTYLSGSGPGTLFVEEPHSRWWDQNILRALRLRV